MRSIYSIMESGVPTEGGFFAVGFCFVPLIKKTGDGVFPCRTSPAQFQLFFEFG